MTKVFIEVFNCKTPHKIFTGKDALKHALFYIEKGFICDDANLLYKKTFKGLKALSWHNGGLLKVKDEIEGLGVHMKGYELDDHLIFSSQNNVHSPLFEFAILYKKKPNLLTFFYNTFMRAKAYSKWWKTNNYYGLKGKKNEIN